MRYGKVSSKGERAALGGQGETGVGTALFSLTVKPIVTHGTRGPAQCPVCRIGSTLLVETTVNRGPSGAPLRMVSVWSVHPRQAFRPGFARPSDSRPSWESLFLSLPVACMAQVLGGWASGGYEPSDWQPRRHARALYSPVPTLATLLVLRAPVRTDG